MRTMKRILNGRLKQFSVSMENRPGTLADLCERLASQGINIKAISADGDGIKIVTSDEQTTRDVLSRARLLFEEIEVLQIKLLDRPGELAKISRLLAREKVNIDAVYLLGGDGETTDIILRVNNIMGALKILK